MLIDEGTTVGVWAQKWLDVYCKNAMGEGCYQNYAGIVCLISSFPSWLRGFDSLRLLQLKRADFTFWEVKSARFLSVLFRNRI